MEYSDISVMKEEIPSLKANVLNHTAIKLKTVFRKTVENNTDAYNGVLNSANCNAASTSESQSSSSLQCEEETHHDPGDHGSDYDPEEAKIGVTQRKKIVIVNRAPLHKTAGGLAVYDGDFITKLRSTKSRLNADRSAAFKERESNNGEIVIGVNFQRKSLEQLFHLRNAVVKETIRNSQRRRTIRPYTKYAKILSALDEEIENMRDKGGGMKDWSVRSKQPDLFDDLIKHSSCEFHEVTGKCEVDGSTTCDLKDSSGDLNKIIDLLQQQLEKKESADSYDQADLEHESHCSIEESSHSLQKNVKGSTSKTRLNQSNSKQNTSVFSRSCRQTRSSSKSSGFRQIQLGKRTNSRPSNSDKQEMEIVNSIDYDPNFAGRKKQKYQVKYDSPPHFLDLKNYRVWNKRFQDVEEGSSHIRQDGDEIQFCKNLTSAMFRNRVSDGSENESYFTVGGKNRPAVLMPSRGGGCARLRTYVKVMERSYYC